MAIPPSTGKFKCKWCATVGDKRAYNQCYCDNDCRAQYRKNVLKDRRGKPDSRRHRRIQKRERGLFYDCLRCGHTFIRKSIKHEFCKESCRKPGYTGLQPSAETDDVSRMRHADLQRLNWEYVNGFITRREAGDMSVTIEQYEQALAWLSIRSNWPTTLQE